MVRMQVPVRSLRVGDLVMAALDPRNTYGRVSAVNEHGFWYEGRWDQVPFVARSEEYVFWIERDVPSREDIARDIAQIL